jgi:inosine-uridine nucleoside N-ribohydrolase
MTAERPQVVIDCDPGHDDAVAIFLALQHADVHGITTVSGNAPLEAVTRNALGLVELVGAKVPVHAGADRPMTGEPTHATHVHGTSGFGDVVLPPTSSVVASDDAVAFLLETSMRVRNLWVVAIGPLTNIAAALARDPAFANRIEGISIMGGSTNVGNATPVAEFNILADPEAAAAVFDSGARLKMAGLNLTRQLMTDDDYISRMRDGGDVARLVADLYAYMHERMIDLTGERRAALHDPCAVLAITHPPLLQSTPRSARVEIAGTHTRGMTVVDERPGPLRTEPNVEVGYTIDAAAAKEVILSALLAY